jgi:hypothetical protein
MIIAIGGRMGSGKNTVCDIIQDLCKKHNGPSFEQKAFAGKLKQTASLLTGVDVEKFEDQEFKKLEMPECWNKMQQSGRNRIMAPMTYRQFLQELGTEAMRDGLHSNVWVNALFADYHLTPDKNANELFTEEFLTGSSTVHYEYPNWIITDMRFENELEAVVKHKGIAIRVVRPGRTLTGTHPSEIALDGFIMHYEIINDGTIEDLIEKVREILIKENII